MSKEYRVVGVCFIGMSKIYYFNPRGFQVAKRDKVIIETARGLEYGIAVTDIRMVREKEVTLPLKSIIRLATPDDVRQLEENIKDQQKAINICMEKIAKHKLPMKLLGAEYTFDKRKIIFCFTSAGRVDFRDLIKDLAGILRTRIELKQVGVRDEARHICGYGHCGRKLCCCSHFGDFETVSIKMAKNQGVSLNPIKISGICGRLMCCLKYEDEVYTELRAKFPKEGSYVETPNGRGKVVQNSFLSNQVVVMLEDGGYGKFKLDEMEYDPAGYEEIVVSDDEEILNESIGSN